jgi:hypothetical protein
MRYVTRFFGEPWPSGVCDDGVQVATPVGSVCLLCSDPIEAGDQGSFFADGSPEHRECSLRSVIGGIEHLTAGPHAVGTCYDGSTLSYRESAIQAWQWVQEHGMP